ncbi:MAG: helix-turn-helix domain-containing protein, partial [Pseudonocardiaceae bacterium]
MSDDHADEVAKRGNGSPAPEAEKQVAAIDPALYDREDLRQILAMLDIASLYWALKNGPGLSQRQIAARTGQSQSEVAAIVAGRRRVENYHLLVRIAKGLNIPPERMGLSWWSPDGTYCGQEIVAEPLKVVSADVQRRQLLTLGATATFGAPIKGGDELAQLGDPTPEPLPSQLNHAHVVKVRNLIQRLLDIARVHGPDVEFSRAAVAWATRLLSVPGPEPVTQALLAAVADLHTIAGSGAYDATLYDHTLYHYERALELAIEAGDAYLQALALTYAGLATDEHGHPDEGLKMLQFAQVKAWELPRDHDRRHAVEATALAHSATAYARLGDP